MNNQITVEGDVARIVLSQGYVTVIDAADVELVSQYRWHAWVKRRKDGSISHVYATTNVPIGNRRKRTTRMHRLITGAPQGMDVDHVDHDGLNNTQANLRICTKLQNRRNQILGINNTSGYKGVFYLKTLHKWLAYIYLNGKQHYLGYFPSAIDAAAAYNAAAVTFFGDFAHPNPL